MENDGNMWKTVPKMFGGLYKKEKNLIDTLKRRIKPHKHSAPVFVPKDDSLEIKVARKFF